MNEGSTRVLKIIIIIEIPKVTQFDIESSSNNQ